MCGNDDNPRGIVFQVDLRADQQNGRSIRSWLKPADLCPGALLRPAAGVTGPAAGGSDVENSKPWPEVAFERILETAPEYLRRAAFLGRATGQRRSDLVRFGRKRRREDGLQIKVGKLQDRDHFIPLKSSELAEIDSWSCSDTGPWITNKHGEPMSGSALRSALDSFLAKAPELAGLNLNPHGLRAMAVCDRRLDGLPHQEISAQLCRSIGMVMRYSKHIDQERLARGGNQRREQKERDMVK